MLQVKIVNLKFHSFLVRPNLDYVVKFRSPYYKKNINLSGISTKENDCKDTGEEGNSIRNETEAI